MQKSRLEALSDGVMVVPLTVMVLGVQIPQGIDFAALQSTFPTILSYILSFLYIGIY